MVTVMFVPARMVDGEFSFPNGATLYFPCTRFSPGSTTSSWSTPFGLIVIGLETNDAPLVPVTVWFPAETIVTVAVPVPADTATLPGSVSNGSEVVTLTVGAEVVLMFQYLSTA